MLHVRGTTDIQIPCEEEQDACDLTRLTVTENGTYMPDEEDGYYQVDVNVPSGYPEPTGTKTITANGTGIDVKDFATADVNVPNSYSASDEGKVVSNGALVVQGSQTITQNGTYDTTLINELIANISGGGGVSTLLDREQTQTSGSTITIDETLTISEAGDYYIIAFGFADAVQVYINGTLQANDFSYSADYVYSYAKKVTLSAGDTVRVNLYGSGRTYLRAFVAKVVDSGGQFPFVDEAYNSNYGVGVAIVTPDLANLEAFNENYARTKSIFVGRKKTLDSTDVGETLSQYTQSASIEPTSLEYYGNVYGNSSMISDLGLVLLGDFSQGGSTTGNVLADSIDNYTAVILQGIYQKQRTSNYNTSMLYVSPLLNTAYWAGMKDRNSSYDCNVTFTDDTTVRLSGNRQVIIYGML